MDYPLFVMKVKKWGTSQAIILPTAMRKHLNISLGDIIAIRVHPPYATFCVWRGDVAVSLRDIPVRALPPLNPKELQRA